MIHQKLIEVTTRPSSLNPITQRVNQELSLSGLRRGVCSVFIQHTSASLVIQENADPAVCRDLQAWLSDLAPESRAWEHDDEGPDDMPAHAKAALTKTSEQIPFNERGLCLGTWQGIYVWEHRSHSHTRRVFLHFQGE